MQADFVHILGVLNVSYLYCLTSHDQIRQQTSITSAHITGHLSIFTQAFFNHTKMDAKSASSASKSAASVLSSGSSAAARAASSASASLSSASVRASGTAAATAADVKASAAGFTLFGLSAVNLSIIGIILGAAYYNGYLDGIIAQLQALLGQAQDKKEQVMKDQTGHRHVRDAASGMFLHFFQDLYYTPAVDHEPSSYVCVSSMKTVNILLQAQNLILTSCLNDRTIQRSFSTGRKAEEPSHSTGSKDDEPSSGSGSTSVQRDTRIHHAE